MKKLFTVFLMLLAVSVFLISCNKKENSAAGIPAQVLCQQFKSELKANKSISLEELCKNLSENKVLEFSTVIMEVEEGYLNGFTDEINGFSEGEIFAPLIGAIPFVGYVFRTENPSALMATLKEKADLRWNVCTAADEMVIDSVDDIVFFVMAPKSFEE